MQSFYGPKTRGGKEYKVPGVTLAYLVENGTRHEFQHARLDMELDAEKKVTVVWRAYQLNPGVRQGMKPTLEASAHFKTNAATIARGAEYQPFFTLEHDGISLGSSLVQGAIGMVLEPQAIRKLQRFVARVAQQGL